jgi:hypothetical protein
MIKQDIIIIGSGIGGLTAGALLTKKGFKVKIFEKETLIGGRALTFQTSKTSLDFYLKTLSNFNMNVPFSEPDLKTIFDKKMLHGYKLDLGYHAIGGGVLSNANSVLSELNNHVDILESYVGLINDKGYDFPFLSKFDKFKILPNILRLLLASEKTLKKLDKVSINETIDRYGRGKMRLILEIFSRSITTINNLDLISTGEMFRSQRNLYRGSKPVGYPKKGLESITEKLANYIQQNGGKIYLNKKVERIIIENKKIKGIIVDKKEYPSDIVVSNILVQDLFEIAEKRYFPEKYVTNIKSLKGTGSLCAYYSINKIDPKLIGKTFHFIERNVGVEGFDTVGMIDFMAASPDSGIAPANKFVVQSYIICSPDEAKNIDILKKLRKLLDKNIEILIPNYKNNLNWAIYPAIWHLDGVAKTIDNEKPDIKTPIENLFIIGDSVKATGIGFNCALNSARLLVKYLSNDNQD